ncbi:YopX family protein [Lacticaseibacillus paracasei]|uniref:YopX family protein n=1 Tax=Lacticaseibacillus paracasei TaxID=1597 RepID=UPI0025A18112|nr:YopX family protein [Lacticaseibacillus paracasei]MDM7525448.1 YopX family protein [Lacticaseibacillus paracasei]
MKREIKFRGYDPDTKRWYYGSLVKQNKTTYVTSEDYDQNPSNTEWFILWDEMTDWCLPNRHLQGSVDPKSIGEYTGLHDKNGRSIYEGDIVCTGKDNIGDPDPMIGQVIMREGSWLIENDKKQEAVDLFSEITSREVIGNIFEEKQLLEGKQ